MFEESDEEEEKKNVTDSTRSSRGPESERARRGEMDKGVRSSVELPDSLDERPWPEIAALISLGTSAHPASQGPKLQINAAMMTDKCLK